MKTKNELRYEMFKRVVQANRSSRLGRDNIMTVYMSEINKATTSSEIDEVLDAIITNEKSLKRTGTRTL